MFSVFSVVSMQKVTNMKSWKYWNIIFIFIIPINIGSCSHNTDKLLWINSGALPGFTLIFYNTQHCLRGSYKLSRALFGIIANSSDLFYENVSITQTKLNILLEKYRRSNVFYFNTLMTL